MQDAVAVNAQKLVTNCYIVDRVKCFGEYFFERSFIVLETLIMYCGVFYEQVMKNTTFSCCLRK
jgi:hypothetical protein